MRDLLLTVAVAVFMTTPGLAQSPLRVDEASLSTTRIVLSKAGTAVSLGTGFFYMRAEGAGKVILFLVTNHHVLTGHAPGEAKAPLGDEITFWCHRTVEAPQSVVEHKIRLYNAKKQPIWISSRSAPDADIAVIPLPASLAGGCKVVALNRDTNSAMPMPLIRPSSSVALVGYPYGFFDQHNNLPIWKTGAIASEPSTDFGGRPVIVVDVSAFPGMSGSPVYAITNGPYETMDAVVASGRTRSFIGIFSAMRTLQQTKLVESLQTAQRMGVKIETSLELGYVWKESLIRQIVDNFDGSRYQSEILLVK